MYLGNVFQQNGNFNRKIYYVVLCNETHLIWPFATVKGF